MAREAREISKAREIVATLARESDQTYDLALAILFPGAVPANANGRRRRADPDARAAAGAGRSRAGSGTTRFPGTPLSRRRGAAIARAAAAARPGGSTGLFRRRRQLEHAVRAAGPLGGGAAWIRLGRGSGIDRRPFSFDAARDGRWGYRINMPGTEAMSCAGLWGWRSRHPAEPGRAADGAGPRCGAGGRPGVSGGLARGRPGCPPCRQSVGHLLSLVARASLRGAGPSLARRV